MATISSNITGYNSSHSYYAISNASNGYYSSSDTSYASVNLTRGSGANTYIYWEFTLPTIPTGATINSIACNYKARTSSASTSYIAQATIQMCTGTTTKGTARSILTTSTNASSFTTSEIGTWTVAQLNAGVKLRTSATRGTSRTNSNYYIYFYGADISITYTEPVSGNTVYIKANGTWKEASEIYVKNNGTWSAVSSVYKKASDSWVLQSDKSAVFNQNTYFAAPTGYVNTNLVMNLDGITSYANRYNDNYMDTGITDVGMFQNDVTCDGRSFEFNGTSSYMYPSASAQFDNFLYNTHTLEIYFEPYDWGNETGNRTSIYVGRASNSIGLFAFINSNNSPAFIRSCSTGTKMLEMPSLPEANKKHYLAFNNNGWLLDGTYYSDASLTSSTNYIALNDLLIVDDTYKCVSIGRRFRSSQTTQYFHGKIYALRIHNTLLTEEQMRTNMAVDIARFTENPDSLLRQHGYKRIPALSSTGTLYIDTGQTLYTATDDVYIDYACLDSVNTNLFFGARNTTTSTTYTLAQGPSAWRMGWGSSTTDVGSGSVTTGRHLILVNHTNGTVIIDNTIIDTKNDATITTPVTAGLFAARNASLLYYATVTIYEYKLYRSGKLIQHMIPALRLSDSVLGMYDLVTNTFFTNQGTGIFQILPSGFTLKSYILTSGTQLIDTDYIPTVAKGSSIEVVLARVSSSTNEGFGSNNNLNVVNQTSNWRINGTLTTFPITNDEFISITMRLTPSGRYYAVGSLSGTGSSNETANSFLIGKLGGSTTYTIKAKFSLVKIKEHGKTVKELIPAVRASDSVVGMYDIVNFEFLTNSGTGTLSYG